MLRRLRVIARSDRGDAGFTLMELVIAVALLGIIIVALTGVVLSYLKTTVSAQARLTESHDVQFASVYWQRDVASVGRRDTTYDPADDVHTFPLLQSVAVEPNNGIPVGCGALPGRLITLSWTQITADPEKPDLVTVQYAVSESAAPYSLVRRRCTKSADGINKINATVTVADNLATKPVIGCDDDDADVLPDDDCNAAGTHVPMVVVMKLTSYDADNNDGSTYSATLTGERRQS